MPQWTGVQTRERSYRCPSSNKLTRRVDIPFHFSRREPVRHEHCWQHDKAGSQGIAVFAPAIDEVLDRASLWTVAFGRVGIPPYWKVVSPPYQGTRTAR